jgi:hypothetical protein
MDLEWHNYPMPIELITRPLFLCHSARPEQTELALTEVSISNYAINVNPSLRPLILSVMICVVLAAFAVSFKSI